MRENKLSLFFFDIYFKTYHAVLVNKYSVANSEINFSSQFLASTSDTKWRSQKSGSPTFQNLCPWLLFTAVSHALLQFSGHHGALNSLLLSISHLGQTLLNVKFFHGYSKTLQKDHCLFNFLIFLVAHVPGSTPHPCWKFYWSQRLIQRPVFRSDIARLYFLRFANER